MTLALVGFFFLMKAVGLEHNLELRALNIIILASLVFAAIKRYKKQSNGHLPYLPGISVGIITSAVGVVLFAIFIFLYLTVIAPEFMTMIEENEPFGNYLNPFLISFTIVLEGIISGLLASYASLQYLRPSHMNQPSEVLENQ